MGYSVLYIAFAIVALWLLGEVLLQYKARLRWRLLAFAGFMGVVGGVALREVIVIVLGAVAFGTGQAFVTLSYKRGFSTGWALGGRPGSSRRRKGGALPAAEPVLEVTPVEEDFAVTAAAATAAEEMRAAAEAAESVYRPVPIHDDSGEYPLYDGQSSYTPDPYTSGGYEGYGAQGYAGWGGEQQPAAAGAAYEGGYGSGYDGGYDQSGWGGQGYGYDPAAGYQEQPAAAGYDTGTGGGSTGAYGYDGYSGYGGGQATGTGDWTPQPHPQHQEPYRDSYQDPQYAADPYAAGTAYGYDPQAQPYIPQQPQPYEQGQHDQQGQESQQQPQYTAEYADPYDPYRY